MRVRVRARLFCSGDAEEIVEGILSNEDPACVDREPVLLVDGEPTQLRYEVLGLLA